MGHVSEVSALWRQLFGYLDGLVKTVVRDVGPRAQRIQNQNVEVLQKRPAIGWNAVRIRAVGDVAEAETEHIEFPMQQPDRHDPLAQQCKRLRRDAVYSHVRHAAGITM